MFKISPDVGLESPTRHPGGVRHIPGVQLLLTMWYVLQVRHILFALAACVAFCSAIPLLAQSLLAQSDEIAWFSDYGQAVQEAKRTGKPIFLEFRCES